MVMVLDWLSQLVQLPSRAKILVEMACNGLGPLQRVFLPKQLSPSTPHFDLLSTIRLIVTSLPLKLQGCHVWGHANPNQPFSALDWWELCNVKVDKRAQAYRWTLLPLNLPPLNPRFLTSGSFP